MEHALHLADVGFVSGLGPMGFGAETMFDTLDGPRLARDIRPGQALRGSDGRQVQVTAVSQSAPTDRWVSLPIALSETRLIVAADQPLICRHFLCAALFGATEAIVRPGDLVGSRVQPSHGAELRLVRLELDGQATLALGGYLFLCRGSVDDGIPPTDSSNDGAEPAQTRMLIGPQEARQLRDTGILFRKAAQP